MVEETSLEVGSQAHTLSESRGKSIFVQQRILKFFQKESEWQYGESLLSEEVCTILKAQKGKDRHHSDIPDASLQLGEVVLLKTPLEAIT
ncbi:hypothetical protein CDAR_96471 [Caerostris darwini]|uniref:Uncharacterized protein n=1 Tax=Caerostris darwini TaxID=1538125 RepID=A0AAV4WS74_9ARAC|nr:hypothetical protein CDAR_96471 [Caerostris darwini]